MPIAMTLGLGGFTAEIDALMVLSVNGTVFGVSNEIARRLDVGARSFSDADAVRRELTALRLDRLRIGVPFHFSMHQLLLKYWLEASPKACAKQVEIVTIPPPRIADAMENGEIDAFWVGEPWGSVAVSRGVGALILPGNAIWSFAPEKVLAARRSWSAENPVSTRKLMRAIHHAARWLDQAQNKPLAVEILARSAHLNLAPDLIDPAISGHLQLQKNASPVDVNRFVVFHDGTAGFPWRSQAAWIAARLGASNAQIALAKTCFRSDLFRANLGAIGVDLPGASEKIEGAMQHATAVSSTRGHMILGPDAFFDRKTYENGIRI